MNCPNCKIPFVEEKAGKFSCVTCGWFEKVGKEWQGCEAPEPEPVTAYSPEPVTESQSKSEPNPAALEPDPAALEPDPAAQEPDPARSVRKYLGGLVTITEVDE